MTQKAIKAIVGTGGGIIAASLAVNGYAKFANGLTIQWGQASSVASVTFPIAFNTVYSITGINSVTSVACTALSETGFSITTTKGTTYWIAVGKIN